MDNNWRLERIEIQFKKGYSFEKKEEKKHDRYEGVIEFENGEFESFCFKVRPKMAQKYIQLMSDDIVKSARSLGDRLIESLALDKKE